MLKTAQTVSSLPVAEPLSARAARAAEVAAAHADAVDADSRFPQEALDALKAEKLLGILVPASLGGEASQCRRSGGCLLHAWAGPVPPPA